MNKFIRLNTVIIPPKEIIDRSIEISNELSSKYETEFTLDGRNFNPHVTLYSPEFPLKNLETIKAKVKEVAQNHKVFTVDIKDLAIVQESKVFGVEIGVVKSKELDLLHREIIKELNPLRENHLREKYKDEGYVNKFPVEKRELMKKIMYEVGYPRVLDVYGPHISITLFKPSVKRENIVLPKFKEERIKIEQLGIYTMGEFGTCKDLLCKFNLSSN